MVFVIRCTLPSALTVVRHRAWSGVLLLALGLAPALRAQSAPPLAHEAPHWGLSSSASSFKNFEEWFPRVAAIGVSSVRLFPGWSHFEPTPGAWRWDRVDALLKSAAENKIEINAILLGAIPGKEKGHTFPMSDLGAWSNFVTNVVGHCRGRVRSWEVWNEGNGGFNNGHHTTVDYARLAAATYAAAKKADPEALVGLTVASFDAPYLEQTIRAQKAAGTPNSFDFLCIHPYELADGVGKGDGEIPYLWMGSTLRRMLKEVAPEKVQAPIWITEVGRHIKEKHGAGTTDADAARVLPKLYTMALAQGIPRTQWFEAQDPAGEEAGFGLLKRDGQPRPAFKALQTLTAALGAAPVYKGWLALGQEGKGYGFVFRAAAADVLVAWMPGEQEDKSVTLAGDVTVVNTMTGESSPLIKGAPLALTDAPLLIVGLPADLVARAEAQADRPFPWGGDFTSAQAVSCQPGLPRGSAGLFRAGRKGTPYQFEDGSTGLEVKGDEYVNFWTHPSFAGLQTREYYIRITVRRLGPGNIGMNLNYEVADSQGRSPYRNRGQWYSLSPELGWQTHTWKISDASFAKMWGSDFNLHPEKAAPFVLGKVEVSTVPFAAQ